MSARPVNIQRSAPRQNFTILPNAVMNDDRLEGDEMAVLLWLLAKPPNWEVRRSALTKRFKYGRDRLRRIFKKLIDIGYSRCDPVRREDGTIEFFRYMVADEPILGGVPSVQETEIDDDEGMADAEASIDQPPSNPSVDAASDALHHSLCNTSVEERKSLDNKTPLPPEAVPVAAPPAIEEAKPDFKSLIDKWPPDCVLSRTEAERVWLRLTDTHKRAAIAGCDGYRSEMRRKAWKVCDLTTYLRGKRFERFASGAPPTASFPIKGGTPQAYRWLEYRKAMGLPTSFMEDRWRSGLLWYAASEWPPALPDRESTGPPSDSDAMTEFDAELAKG